MLSAKVSVASLPIDVVAASAAIGPSARTSTPDPGAVSRKEAGTRAAPGAGPSPATRGGRPPPPRRARRLRAELGGAEAHRSIGGRQNHEVGAIRPLHDREEDRTR